MKKTIINSEAKKDIFDETRDVLENAVETNNIQYKIPANHFAVVEWNDTIGLRSDNVLNDEELIAIIPKGLYYYINEKYGGRLLRMCKEGVKKILL